MKRVAVVVSAGLVLAVVVAAQALKAPEREPVTPIELPAPIELPVPTTRSDAEPGETPAREKPSRRGTTSGPGPTRRQAPATQPPSSEPPASAESSEPLSPAPEQPLPPPASGSDDRDDDEPLGDDDSSGADDAGDDDTGDN